MQSGRKIFLKNIYLKSQTLTPLSHEEIPNLTIVSQSFEPIDFDEYVEKLDTNYCSLKDWKKDTNLLCWNCTLKPLSTPYFIPLSWTMRVVVGGETRYKVVHNFPDAIGKKEEKMIKPFGNFCTKSCAARHIDITDEIPELQKANCLALLCLLVYEFTGERVTHITRAPPKERMIKFCGENGWTEEKYRSMLN